MQYKSIKKNFIYNSLLTVGNIAIPLITFPYVSRILNPMGLGMANYANSVVSYLILFACFGVNTYGIKEGAKYRDIPEKMCKFTREMLLINTITVGISLLILIGLCFIPFHHPYISLLILYGIQIITSTFSMSWFVSAIEEFRYVTIRSIIIQLICMLLTFILVRESSDYIMYAFISVASSLLTMLVNVIFVRRKISGVNCHNYEIKKHIKPMVLILGGSLSATIYSNSDITMLGIFSGDYHVGIYSVSVKIVRIMITFVSSLSTVILPRNSYYKKNSMVKEYESLLKKGLDFLLMFSIPSTIGISLLSRELILLFVGNQYLDSINNLRLLAFNIIISSFSAYIAYQIVLIYNGEKIYFTATLVSCIINLVLNYFLIPVFNENAAALTTLLAEALNGIICIVATRKRIQYKNLFKDIKDYVISSFIMACVVVIIKFGFRSCDSNLFILAICAMTGSIVYGMTLIFLKNYLFISLVNQLKNKFKRI